jgi:hemerythrin
MSIIQWDESFSVNVAEIDKQHQRLLEMINELYDAMRQGRGKVIIGKTITVG